MSEVAQLSVQLYTVRDALANDFDGTLGRIAEIGYTQVEPFAFTNFTEQLKEGLGKHGLAAPTTHVGLLSGDQAEIFAAARELGIGTVIEPAVREPHWQTEEDIAATAQQLNSAAEQAAEHGLRVGYHNHWWEIERDFGGRHGLEVLAEHLTPEVVLEVDTYWAVVGGADVPALLGRLGDRVVALHIKDGDGTRDTKKQVPLGSGSIPIWDFVAAKPDALRVVELDDSEVDMLDAVEQSYSYITKGA
ncbi:MAG TPA: TIM barrel protein [Microlunatus sp.]